MIDYARLIRDPNGLIQDMAEKMRHWKENLRGWQESDGYLVPTEPDPVERECIRRELQAAINVFEDLAHWFEGGSNAI